MRTCFILISCSLLISAMTGCQTYFGYNKQQQVITQADFQKEHSDTMQKWQKYAECYFQPLGKDTKERLQREAKKLYEEKYGNYYPPNNRHAQEQYEKEISECFNEAAHTYRMLRGVTAKKFPSYFRTIYPSSQSFRTAMETWERKYLAVENEIQRTNLPDTVQVSSVAQNYFYKDGLIYGNYIVKTKEPLLNIETRSHIYSDNAFWFPPFVFLRYPFDFFACFLGRWELATHKPNFFTLVSYCPPFSWFFTRTPPYFTNPSPWKTEYQVIISTEKNIVAEREKTQQIPQSEIAQAIEWLQKKADDGNPTAQFDLATIYNDGEYVPRNPEKALKLYELAAQSGNASAEKYVFELLSASELEARSKQITDTQRKARYLKAAADKGSSTAQFSYAMLCDRDNDGKQALVYLKKSAEQGNMRAIELLFQQSAGRSKTYKEAGIELGKYADILKNSNSPSGLYIYAEWCFLNNRRQDALKYLRISAERGVPDAQYHLASILGYGNWSAAVTEKKGMDGGTAFALALFPVLVSGEYIQPDYQESFVWMKKAAEAGSANAREILPDIEAKAKQYLAAVRARQAAEREFANPQNTNIIRQVKNTVFMFDESRTLEVALASQMDNLKWRFFTSTMGKKVVEVVGEWKNDRYNPGKDDVGALLDFKMKFPQKGDEVMAQFVIKYSDYSPVEFAYGEIRDSQGVCKTFLTGQTNISSEKGTCIRISTDAEGPKRDIFIRALYGIDSAMTEVETQMRQYEQVLKMLR